MEVEVIQFHIIQVSILNAYPIFAQEFYLPLLKTLLYIHISITIIL